MFVEGLGGGLPVEGFAGSTVERYATASRLVGECLWRSVRLGKYWRRRPLVFSLVPRCHGLCGSQKVDGQAGVDAELSVLCHFGALVPGQRLPELFG